MQYKHLCLNPQISIFLLCHKGHTFEENNYPLEIAEIELSHEEEDLNLPPFISEEITGLKHFSNFSLAKKPFSEWKEDYLTTFKSN